MIHSIDRLPKEYKGGGWFCINKHVNIKIYEEDDVYFDVEYDDEIITETEAQELAEELISTSIEFAKGLLDASS